MAASPVSMWSKAQMIFDCLIIWTIDSIPVQSIFSTRVSNIVNKGAFWGYIYKIWNLNSYLITNIVGRQVVMQRKRNDWNS